MTLLRTHATRAVARILVDNPNELHWAGELCQVTKEKSNVISPLLARMCREGLIEDAGQKESPLQGKRRGAPRHMFRVVDVQGLRQLL
jgi:hypothetical protein